MWCVLLWIGLYVITAQVHSEELPSPQDVYVNNSLLTWAPAHQHNVTYTVQYQSSDSKMWKDVPSCVETALNSCDVARIQKAAKYGCVELRVQAHTHNRSSTPAEACTRLGDSCGPSVDLSAQPGSLSVNLNSSHRLLKDHRHAKYRLHYGLEGQPLEEYKIYAPETWSRRSSVSIRELDERQSYCVYVQIVLYDVVDVGPRSCLKCTDITSVQYVRALRKSGETQRKIIVAVLVVIVVVVVLVGIAHSLLNQPKWMNRIKQWSKLEPTPQCLCPLPDHQYPLIAPTPLTDQCDCISVQET